MPTLFLFFPSIAVFNKHKQLAEYLTKVSPVDFVYDKEEVFVWVFNAFLQNL